jgi:hypothetical protein
LAYILRAEAEDILHPDFVQLAETEASEETWLRQVLAAHVHFTQSPRAARLLSRRGALPLLRVQPIHFQGTPEATWRPVLSRIENRSAVVPEVPAPHVSQAALHA